MIFTRYYEYKKLLICACIPKNVPYRFITLMNIFELHSPFSP